MSKIADNIKVLRKLKGLSQSDLAERLMIPRSRLASYEEKRAEPPYDLLIKLVDYFHISADAIIRGNLSKTKPEKLIKIGDNRTLFPIVVDKADNNFIELVPLKAQAGYLRGYADPEFIEELPRINLPNLVKGKNRAFPISGDSMPPLTQGCFVIGEYLESLEEVKNGETYIMVTKEEGIVYKRLYIKNKKEGILELRSDNKNYPSYTVKGEDIKELWEYRMALTAKYKPEELNLESIMAFLREMKIDIESLKN